MHLDKRFSVFCPKKLKEILGFSKSRRERPIKTMFEDPTVAPRAGAWIETAIGESLFLHQGEKEVGVK